MGASFDDPLAVKYPGLNELFSYSKDLDIDLWWSHRRVTRELVLRNPAAAGLDRVYFRIRKAPARQDQKQVVVNTRAHVERLLPESHAKMHEFLVARDREGEGDIGYPAFEKAKSN